MSAVRCLFPINDTDRKIMNQELDAQARKIDEAETKRFIKCWGFNPEKGIEVEGSPFEYTLLDSRSMPAMYSSVYKGRPTRPVSRIRSPARSPTNRCTKRKLQFDMAADLSNDENKNISETGIKPSKQAKITSILHPSAVAVDATAATPSMAQSCPSMPESNRANERLHPVDVSELSRSVSVSTTFVQLSPDTKALEYITPNMRSSQVKMVQREITDYVPIRKASSLKMSSLS
ncbi:hypothetical protein PoB_001644100 [Plakobranchus ocellatus]|uniref:Cyclin-dependent kinase inhibitor domain-containing protein n=1 Tax=Plakobranchus ocellatus TaxID=259542 RepID=A0AAV3Z5R9_9GAST|nr:hypothetical protein PoB_001644100 [Plakobranchus ocellatus]